MGTDEPVNPYQAPRSELVAAAPATALSPALEDAIAGRYKFSIGDVMGDAWELVKGMKASFWGAFVVIGCIWVGASLSGAWVIGLFLDGQATIVARQIFNGVVGVLMTPFTLGLQMMCVRRALGLPTS